MRDKVDIEAVVGLFKSMQEAFPHLTMRLDRNDPNVDLNMDIPSQPGLGFDVNVNLQDDELHLGVGALWLNWSPCTAPGIVGEFREVDGLLSGTFRVVEHRRGQRAVKAELQRRGPTGWEAVGASGRIHLPIGPKSTRVLQNGNHDAVQVEL